MCREGELETATESGRREGGYGRDGKLRYRRQRSAQGCEEVCRAAYSLALKSRPAAETYSSGVKVARSFRSAPAQKLESTSLANISARVAPVSPSWCMLFIWCVNSASSWREMALRAAGRLKDNMRMLPECGAGTLVTFTTGDGAVEYVQRCTWRAYSRKVGLRRSMVDQF